VAYIFGVSAKKITQTDGRKFYKKITIKKINHQASNL
jgi:hypothetical protein